MSQAHLLTAAELKRRGITRYDAEIILEQGLSLPSPRLVLDYRMPHPAEGCIGPISTANSVPESYVSSTEKCTIDKSDTSDDQPQNKNGACSKISPCVQRTHRQRVLNTKNHQSLLTSCCKLEETHCDNKELHVQDEKMLDFKCRGEVTTVPVVAEENPMIKPMIPSLLVAEGHQPVLTSDQYFSQHANGKLHKFPTKIKNERIPIRQSPRLRQPSGLEVSKSCVDNALDSNHNFHEPPVLEPEAPILSPAEGGYEDTAVSEVSVTCKLEQSPLYSSHEVPQLSFCGNMSSVNNLTTSTVETEFKRKGSSDASSPTPKFPRMVLRMPRDPILEEKLSQCRSSAIIFKWKQPKKLRLRFDGNSVERYLPHDTNYPS